ncbi:MAG: enoyl-CoA hydratase [Brachymonas sp.]|nr:enoyl-CoA hydratase [Brachymonas sp.]
MNTSTAPWILVNRWHGAHRAGVVELQLNRPDSFNALSTAMMSALQFQLNEIAQDESVRAVVISSQGRAFCAGHDLKEMAATPELSFYQTLFEQCSKMMLSVAKLPVPVIAKVQGLATAAGCQLVAQCDLAVSAPQARFAASGIGYGLFCSTPSVPLTRAIAPKQAMQMLLTGEFIDAPMALQYGLINTVAPDDSPEALDAEVDLLVAQILTKPRAALAWGKELVYRQQGLSLEAAYKLAAHTMATNMMHEAAQEGVCAFVEKRTPTWKSA